MTRSGKAVPAPSPSRLVLVALLLLVGAFVAAVGARADGDPASDYLLQQQAFVSPNARVSPADEARLNTFLAAARTAGFTVRAAIIQSRFDLGAVTSLDGKPRLYARFLSQELRLVYKRRLLVVMPNGYGVADDGAAVPREQAVLDGLRPPSSTSGSKLVAAAIGAVGALAAAHGVEPAQLPGWSSPSSGNGWRRGLALAAALVALLLVVGYAGRRGAERSAIIWPWRR
jgi:hypothetical protein